MAEKRDYFDVLGIPKDASDDQITAAYRSLAMKYHPDRNKSSDAEEKMKEINEAYATLSDEQKRSAYLLKNGFGDSWKYSWQYKKENTVGNENWSAIEDEFLFRNFLSMDDNILASKLNKTPSKIKRRRGYLGLIRPQVMEKMSSEPRVQRIVLALRKGQKVHLDIKVAGGNNDIYFGVLGYKGTVNSLRPKYQETISNFKSFNYQIKTSGNYCFYFSNSFSFLTSKNVEFSYQLKNGRKTTLSFTI